MVILHSHVCLLEGIEHAIEIVSFPMNSMVVVHSYAAVYQRVFSMFCDKNCETMGHLCDTFGTLLGHQGLLNGARRLFSSF